MRKSILLVASLFSLAVLTGCDNGGSKPTPKVTLSSIAVSGQKETFDYGDEFSFGGVVTATYSDQTTKVVTDQTTFSGYNMTLEGTQTVTASYTEKDITKTTSYSISVENRSDPPGPQEPVFAAYVDGVAIAGFAKTTADPNMLYQYKAVLDVTAGQTITFTMNRSAISVSASTGENNLVDSVTGLSVHNNASEASLYFKVYGVYNPEDLDTLSFEAWLSGYEDDVGPTEVPYKAYNESTEIELVETEKDEYMLAQYVSKEALSVKQNNLFTFKLDGNILDVHASKGENNLIYNEDGELKVHNDADDVKLYLKVYDDEGHPGEKWFEAYLGGYVESEPEIYLHLAIDGVSFSDTKLSLKDGSETEYVTDELELTTASQLSFLYTKDKQRVTYNYEDVKAGCIDLVKASPEVPAGDGTLVSLNNIMVKKAGKYTFYLDLTADEQGNRIWVATEESEDTVVAYQGENKIEMVACELGDDKMIAQYVAKEPLSVKKGDVFTFQVNDEAITVNLNSPDNNLEKVEDQVVAHNDAETAKLYLKVYDDESHPGDKWYEAYLSGREVIVAKTYLHYTLDNTAEEVEWLDLEMSLKAEGSSEYVSTTLELTTKAELAIKFVNEKEEVSWYHYSDVKAECIDLVEQSKAYLHEDGETYSDDNMVVKADGKYTFYFNTQADDKGDKIWIDRKIEYTLVVGEGEPITMVDVSEKKSESDTWVKQFKAEKVDLVENETLTFFADEVQIFPGAGSNPKNNVVYDNDSRLLSIRTTAEGNVYLKLYKDGGYDTWVEGYEEPVVEQGPTVYFTLPNGWNNLKIYYWGGEHPSTWPGVEMQFVEYNEFRQAVYSFTLPKDATEFLFVNYNSENDHPQTRDISVNEITEEANQFYIDNEGNLQVTLYTPQA